MNYLLDTCVICEMMKKRPDEKVVKWFCKQEPKTLYLSYLTIGEIQKGIVKRGGDARAKRLKTWLEEKILTFYEGRIFPVEKKVATEWGRICGESERNGKTRPSVDALIAATASVHKMKLVTRNEKDMSGMGVPLINPFGGKKGDEMKRLTMVMCLMSLFVMAEDLPEGVMTEEVDGVVWTYSKRIISGNSYSVVYSEDEVAVGFGESAYQVHYNAVATSTSGNVKVPEKLGGKPVTAIVSRAFEGCGKITSISIPAVVNSIGSMAFTGCRALLSVTMNGDAPYVGSDIFADTPRRMVVSVPKGSIGWNGGVTARLPESWCGRAVTHVGIPYDWSGEDGSSSVLTLVTSNVVVQYVLNSVQPEFAIPATSDTGFVNIMTEVKGGAVAIPSSWAESYLAFETKFGLDFTKALTMKTGKKDGAGNDMFVWQDYVAGTDPTKPEDTFTASITVVDGKVTISYSPELDEERKKLRKYTTWGKKSLLDEGWTEVPEGHEADYNFFKVTVEMR